MGDGMGQSAAFSGAHAPAKSKTSRGLSSHHAKITTQTRGTSSQLLGQAPSRGMEAPGAESGRDGFFADVLTEVGWWRGCEGPRKLPPNSPDRSGNV